MVKKILNKLKNKYFSIHYSFIILIVLSCFVNLFWLVFFYFLFLILHELVHGLVAKKLGYQIGRIKLLLTGAVLEAESDEFSFSDEIYIALSAPLFNLFVSILIFCVWWIWPEAYNYTQDILVINLAIFAFNILPIFPLDGGRVLLACLSKNLSRKSAVLITKTIAILFSFLIFVLFIISIFIAPNFSLGITAITLFIGAITEDKMAVYKKLLLSKRKTQRIKNKGIETRYIMVNENFEKSKLIKYVSARFFTIFLFVDNNFKVVKTLNENQIFYNK